MRLLIAFLVLLGSVAFAETVTNELDFMQEGQDGISWEPPVQRVDGKPLDPMTEISSYELECFLIEDQSVIAKLSIPSLTPEGIYRISKGEVFAEYGSYDCTLAAVDTDSLWSDKVSMANGPLSVDPARPMSPTRFILIVK